MPPNRARILSLDRPQQQILIRPQMREALDAVRAEFGGDAPIGLVRGGNAWDYLFFGPDISRRVELLEPSEATRENLAEKNLAGAAFAEVEPPAFVDAEQIGTEYWLVR